MPKREVLFIERNKPHKNKDILFFRVKKWGKPGTYRRGKYNVRLKH